MSEKQKGESRKLQMTGGSTYIISLPKNWVTKNMLKKGSSLVFHEEEDGSLSISTTGEHVREKLEDAFIRVSPNDNPNSAIRSAVAAYLVGYNVIHIIGKNQQPLSIKHRSAIKGLVRRLLVGTEIVTDTPTELTLQVLLSYPELSVESALRRMCIIAASMHKDAIAALQNRDIQLAKGVIATDDEVDRFSLYIVRQLKTAVQDQRIIREIGLNNARDCLGYRLVTKFVERTADHAASIAENAIMLKQPLSDEIMENIKKMSTTAINMFETAIGALFKRDFQNAESVIEKIKEVLSIEKEAVLSSKNIGFEEIASVRLTIESIRRTAEYASDIAEIVLNLAVESMIG